MRGVEAIASSEAEDRVRALIISPDGVAAEKAREVGERLLDKPKGTMLAQALVSILPEPSLEELRMLHSERLGRALPDEDLLLAIVMPAEQLDPMYAAGPAPRWVPASAGPPPTDVASFIAAAHTLPRWRSLRIAFGETRIALDRPAQAER